MSKGDLKRLGDYIREVDVRNRDGKVSNLLGLSLTKEFRPSTSNIIGTDLTKYKVVGKNVFAFDTMSVIRVHKVPICLNQNEEPIIISPAYKTFVVSNTEVLLTEYLNLWFKRPEFDRYADFKSDSAIRGGYGWEELCETPFYLPPIEEQREIVERHKAIQQRLEINRKTIAKLEEVAQAIYRKMFVDDVDPENLPDGWKIGSLTDIAEFINGAPCQNYETVGPDFLPVLKIRELSQGYSDINSDKVDYRIPSKYIVRNEDLIFAWSATLMVDFWYGGKAALNQHLFLVKTKGLPLWYCYFSILKHLSKWKHLISAKATSMGHIKREDLEQAKVIIPNNEKISKLDSIITPIFQYIGVLRKEILILKETKVL